MAFLPLDIPDLPPFELATVAREAVRSALRLCPLSEDLLPGPGEELRWPADFAAARPRELCEPPRTCEGPLLPAPGCPAASPPRHAGGLAAAPAFTTGAMLTLTLLVLLV